MVKEFYSYTQSKYKECLQVFTSGSKDPVTDNSGFAVLVFSIQRTTNSLVVCTVQLHAILMLFEWVDQAKPVSVHPLKGKKNTVRNNNSNNKTTIKSY